MNGLPPQRHDLRLLVAAGAGWLSCLLVLSWPPQRSLALALVLALTALLALRSAQRKRRMLALGLAVMGLCSMAAGWHGAARDAGPVPALAQDAAVVRLAGSLSADPRVMARPGGRSLVIVSMTVKEVRARGRAYQVRTPVVLFTDQRWSHLRWRDHVELTGRLSPSQPGQKEAAVVRVSGPPLRMAREATLSGPIETMRSRFRAQAQRLPSDPAGLVPALVVGDAAGLSADLVDDLRASGLTHLTAVSGANITLALLAVGWICGWLRLPRRARAPVLLLALVGFVLLCRPEPSVLRAAVMGVVGVLATSSGRPSAAAPALGAAMVVLLCLDPWLARSFGFALSVLATLGLVLFARPWGQALSAPLPPRWRVLGQSLAIPIAASATCAPVLVLLQGSVSLVGIPANLLAAPLVAPATVAGLLSAVLASVAPWLASCTIWLAGLPAWGIAGIAHQGAHVPGANLPWPDGRGGALLLAVLILAAICVGPGLMARVPHRRWVLLAAVLIGLALVWPLPRHGWPPPQWRYVACDVGQGDAGVIATGPGAAVMVDAGPDPDLIDDCLDHLGIHTVEALVLTHFHADHVDGLPGVLRGRRVGQLITTPITTPDPHDAPRQQQVLARAAQSGVAVRVVQAGDELRWASVTATVLWPARRISAGSVQNNASVVLTVHTAGLRLLLLGDVEREAQAAVVARLRAEPDPRVDAVKVAHHGSANADPRLIRLVSPAVAVISVGADNDYGHPTPSTLSALAHAGATVVRTDRAHHIAISGQRGSVQVQTW